MSSDAESVLSNYLQPTHFSTQLDFAALYGKETILLASVWFVIDEEIYEELLFIKTLATYKKDESILNVLIDYFNEYSI